MRKKYFLASLGNREKYWERNWRDESIKEAVKFCEIDPLCRIFDQYFPRREKILEAGCGLGQYVIYYYKKGYNIEGVDFSQETIEKILKFDNTLPVRVANVARLSYPDNYFKAYYSGGVVEHFEEGPDRVLKEAHRVLMPEGILIITVPYFNPFRQFSSLVSKDNFTVDADGREVKYVLSKETRKESSPFPGYNFHEYYFRKHNFAEILRKNQFRIIYISGISLIWGLKDMPLFRSFFNPIAKPKETFFLQLDEKYTFSVNLKRYVKKVIISEKSDNFLEKAFLLFFQRMFSNLILFVCKAVK